MHKVLIHLEEENCPQNAMTSLSLMYLGAYADELWVFITSFSPSKVVCHLFHLS